MKTATLENITAKQNKAGAKEFILKILVQLFLLFMFNFAEAQTLNKPVLCASLKDVFEIIVNEFKEKPIWIGVSDHKHNFVLMMNDETKSWTLLETNSERACVLGVGAISGFNRPTIDKNKIL